MVEPRYRYSDVNSPYVAKVDVRIYQDDASGGCSIDNGDFDSIFIDNNFFVLPNVWTRHWLFLDFTNDTIDYWVGDENNAPVHVVVAATLEYDCIFPGDSVDEFWAAEWNSSSVRDNGAPALNFWERNYVVLEDISSATATSIVAAGDQTGEGGGGGGGTGFGATGGTTQSTSGGLTFQ